MVAVLGAEALGCLQKQALMLAMATPTMRSDDAVRKTVVTMMAKKKQRFRVEMRKRLRIRSGGGQYESDVYDRVEPQTIPRMTRR